MFIPVEDPEAMAKIRGRYARRHPIRPEERAAYGEGLLLDSECVVSGDKLQPKMVVERVDALCKLIELPPGPRVVSLKLLTGW